MKIIYDISTRTFASFGDTMKSIGSSVKSGATSAWSGTKSAWNKGSFGRSQALFKAGDALSALDKNKELKAQIFGGRGKRDLFHWRGKKHKGVINQAGQVATAVTGNEKYQQGAQVASEMGKTGVGIGAQIHTSRTGFTHAKDGTRIVANAEKANEFGKKMDDKYRANLAMGGKDRFGGTSWTGNILKQEHLKGYDNRGIKLTGAARDHVENQFKKSYGTGTTASFQQANRRNWVQRNILGMDEFGKNSSISNQEWKAHGEDQRWGIFKNRKNNKSLHNRVQANINDFNKRDAHNKKLAETRDRVNNSTSIGNNFANESQKNKIIDTRTKAAMDARHNVGMYDSKQGKAYRTDRADVKAKVEGRIDNQQMRTATNEEVAEFNKARIAHLKATGQRLDFSDWAKNVGLANVRKFSKYIGS